MFANHRSSAARRAHPSRLATTERLRRHDSERGASLVLAMVFLIVIGTITTGLLVFAQANQRATVAFRSERDERYAGYAAIRAAINWAKDKPKVGRDPALGYPDDEDCVFRQPAVGSAPAVTVTCAATPGGGSAAPTETGDTPDAAILTLGQEHEETAPWNDTADCFVDDEATWEAGLRFRSGETARLGVCDNRDMPFQAFRVTGNVVSNSPVFLDNGSLVVQNGQVKAVGNASKPRCQGSVSPACVGASGAELGDPRVTTTPTNAPSSWRRGTIDWTVRTTAYKADATGALSPGVCGAGRDTMIFLPGFYNNADTLNNLFSSADCKGDTFWFAPSPGADGKLMTPDDTQGVFYFDFRAGSGRTCNYFSNTDDRGRWCVGPNHDYDQQIVGGYPKGWNPLAGAGSTPAGTVVLNRANEVDTNLSLSWSNGNGAKQIGDGQVATYNPVLFSSDRSITLGGFTPKVATGSYGGPITLSVSHREENGGSLNNPVLRVEAYSTLFGRIDCGDYTIPKNTSASLVTSSISSADATRLGACLSQGAYINEVRVTMRTSGNYFNTGSPRVHLDGMSLSLASPNGPAFPGPGAAPVSDCDKDKAGVQFVFGGDTHMYVADGNVQLCAGPAPTTPQQFQQIAVWGEPAVPALRPTSVTNGSGSMNNAAAARVIGEPAGRSHTDISYSTGDNCGFCSFTFEGTVNASMPSYSAPAGMRVKRVDARVTYDSNNLQLLWDGTEVGTSSQLRVGSCTFDAPKTNDMRSWSVPVYENGGTNCLPTSTLASGAGLTWAARAGRTCAFWICSGDSYTDQLDGIELVVTLEASSTTSQVVVPGGGCVTGFPNYWEGRGGFVDGRARDCALIKYDSYDPALWGIGGPPSSSRFSAQGTIYAPSAALEIDDVDMGYPFASRGVVARHLRVKGLSHRSGYTGPMVGSTIDSLPSPREATFVACIRAASRVNSTAACDASAGDRIISRARVRFDLDNAVASTPDRARVPRVVWWTTDQ